MVASLAHVRFRDAISNVAAGSETLHRPDSPPCINHRLRRPKSDVRPDSGAFTANYSDAETVKRLEPYLESLQTPVANYDQVVGVLVAINGKIESIDVFESTPLFRKVWPKLLKSYSLDAANAVDDATQTSAVCTRDTALSLFAETLQAGVASSDTEHGIGLVKRDGRHVLSFTSHIASAGDAAVMGGMGGSVHVSGFAK